MHLPEFVVAALRRHRRLQAAERLAAGELWEAAPLGHSLVFRTPAGTAMDPANLYHALQRLTAEVLGDPWSVHELRHVAASMMLAAGVPLKVVSESLGHSSIRVTADIYAHVLDEARAEAASKLQALLG